MMHETMNTDMDKTMEATTKTKTMKATMKTKTMKAMMKTKPMKATMKIAIKETMKETMRETIKKTMKTAMKETMTKEIWTNLYDAPTPVATSTTPPPHPRDLTMKPLPPGPACVTPHPSRGNLYNAPAPLTAPASEATSTPPPPPVSTFRTFGGGGDGGSSTEPPLPNKHTAQVQANTIASRKQPRSRQ